MTIALNSTSPAFATYLSATLGLVVALLSMQLMAKHQFIDAMDRAHLHFLEERLGIQHLSNREYFYTNGKYRVPDWLVAHKAPRAEHGLARFRSFRVWIAGMIVFAAVNLAIIAVQIWAPGLLDVPAVPPPTP
ncbi:hypothetical protein [Arthrobacter sp. R4-81]